MCKSFIYANYASQEQITNLYIYIAPYITMHEILEHISKNHSRAIVMNVSHAENVALWQFSPLLKVWIWFNTASKSETQTSTR